MADLTNPVFTDADKAREALEAVRWPNGPVCPHCGGTDKNALLQGKSHRPGLYYCGDCTGHFTVTVGTVFERSKIPLNKWWLAAHLLGSSKKGMSAHQLHRMLGVTYKTAWFMAHRIRALVEPLQGKWSRQFSEMRHRWQSLHPENDKPEPPTQPQSSPE